MKEAIYFSHDSNARRDPKIIKIRAKYNNDGYTWFFMILEIMREQEGYRLNLEEWTSDVLAYELGADVDRIKEFIQDSISDTFKVFESDGDYIWSESLLRRMEIKDRINNQNRENAKKGWEKRRKGNATAKQPKEAKENIEKYDPAKEFPLMFSDSGFIESWNAFSKMRKEKKKPMTDRAAKTILNQLSKHPIRIAIAMLDKSEVNSWTDVYPLKEQDIPKVSVTTEAPKYQGSVLDKIKRQNER